MSKNQAGVLGLFVTNTSVDGVLLRKDQNGKVHLVERFTKNRSRRGEKVLHAASILPGLKDRSEADYTMEVSESSSQPADLFLPREFGGAGSKSSGDKAITETSLKKSTTPIGTQLREILSECREAGYPSPTLAFCIGSSEISYQEIGLQDSGSSEAADDAKAKSRVSADDRKALKDRIEETIQGEFDKKRTAFVPMVPSHNRKRFLAVVPSTPDPVASALDFLARSSRQSTPTAQIVDSEISLLVSLVQRQKKEHKGVTAIVRVSSTDTTVLFLKDGVLNKVEHLRSLTSYDSIDTVCSRVVLKQDELRIGKIDDLYVSTEHQGSSALEGFGTFFPDSNVYGLPDALTQYELVDPKGAELRANTIPAASVALRSILGWDKDSKEFVTVNLLDRRRRGRAPRRKGAYAWHTMILLLAMFGTTLYYTWTFMGNKAEIDLRNEEIRLNPPEFPTENAALLRARVDSLQQVYQNHNRAMFVLDSLLTGSDKWSSTLDAFTQSTKSIRRLWLKAWTPQGNSIRVEGNALERNRIAELAKEWNGSIEQLNFAEIQDLRVYSFIMVIPLDAKLPDVVEFLRKTSLEELESSETEALTNLVAHTH